MTTSMNSINAMEIGDNTLNENEEVEDGELIDDDNNSFDSVS